MARANLRNHPLTAPFRAAARGVGSFYVYQTGTTTQASVYDAATGGNVVTQPITWTEFMPNLYVEAAEYTLSANSYTLDVDIMAGDRNAPTTQSVFMTPATAAQNFSYLDINSMSATTTSQLAKFVKIVPQAYLASVGKVVSASGTAIATITGSFVGLYTSDGTTLTRVGVNATNTSSGLWDTNNTMYRQAISGTQPLYPGTTYYVGMLVNATTPGTHAGFVKTANMPAIANTELADPPMYTLASQTSLPTSQAISGLTAAYDLIPWVALTA